MAPALQGLRIIEMVGLGPAPFAAMMLADHGADVVRVHAAHRKGDFPLLDSRFDVLARGRRSLALDLRAPGASDLLLELVGAADGLIEGFRPGVMERMGLAPEECLRRQPRLVYGRMTGWGQQGPLARQAGHDLNYLGLTGALHAIGPADRPPSVPLNYVADFGGGMLLAFGMLAALLAVRGGAPGQVVDAAMVDGAGLLAAMFWGFRAGGGWSDRREGNLLDGGAYFYATYACVDGRFLAVACVERRFHDLLVERLGLDPAVYTHDRDPAQWPALRAAGGAVRHPAARPLGGAVRGQRRLRDARPGLARSRPSSACGGPRGLYRRRGGDAAGAGAAPERHAGAPARRRARSGRAFGRGAARMGPGARARGRRAR